MLGKVRPRRRFTLHLTPGAAKYLTRPPARLQQNNRQKARCPRRDSSISARDTTYVQDQFQWTRLRLDYLCSTQSQSLGFLSQNIKTSLLFIPGKRRNNAAASSLRHGYMDLLPTTSDAFLIQALAVSVTLLCLISADQEAFAASLTTRLSGLAPSGQSS